jgi:hypothetical protein
MNWTPLAILIAFFVSTCTGLGYLAGYLVRRLKWPWLVNVLAALAISCLCPLIVVIAVIYDGGRYAAQHPGEVNDAPAMMLFSVVYVVVPPLFFLGLPLSLIGSLIASRRGSGESLR